MKTKEDIMWEIKRMEEAIEKSPSKYLKNDYSKCIKRMRKKLKRLEP